MTKGSELTTWVLWRIAGCLEKPVARRVRRLVASLACMSVVRILRCCLLTFSIEHIAISRVEVFLVRSGSLFRSRSWVKVRIRVASSSSRKLVASSVVTRTRACAQFWATLELSAMYVLGYLRLWGLKIAEKMNHFEVQNHWYCDWELEI